MSQLFVDVADGEEEEGGWGGVVLSMEEGKGKGSRVCVVKMTP